MLFRCSIFSGVEEIFSYAIARIGSLPDYVKKVYVSITTFYPWLVYKTLDLSSRRQMFGVDQQTTGAEAAFEQNWSSFSNTCDPLKGWWSWDVCNPHWL